MPERNCRECVNSCGNANSYMLDGVQMSCGWEDCPGCAGTGIAGTKTIKLSPDAQKLLGDILDRAGDEFKTHSAFEELRDASF